MSQAPRLPLQTRGIITKYAMASPDRDRQTVIQLIKEELQSKRLRVPKDATLLRIISQARASDVRDPDLDRPWSMASQAHPGTATPGEMLPFVVQAFLVGLTELKHRLTVREALWYCRLFHLGLHMNQEDGETPGGFDVRTAVSNTLRRAIDYAARELVCKKEGRPLDTSDLDGELLHTYLYLDQMIREDFGIPSEGVETFRTQAVEALAQQRIPKPAWWKSGERGGRQ